MTTTWRAPTVWRTATVWPWPERHIFKMARSILGTGTGGDPSSVLASREHCACNHIVLPQRHAHLDLDGLRVRQAARVVLVVVMASHPGAACRGAVVIEPSALSMQRGAGRRRRRRGRRWSGRRCRNWRRQRRYRCAERELQRSVFGRLVIDHLRELGLDPQQVRRVTCAISDRLLHPPLPQRLHRRSVGKPTAGAEAALAFDAPAVRSGRARAP